MSGCPFIALTTPAQYGYEALPVFINAALIRSVGPRRIRKLSEDGKPLTGGPEAHEVSGSWITTGEGDENTFAVAETYGEVTGAIRDALR